MVKEEIIQYAKAQGADMIGVASPKIFKTYISHIKSRLEETQATHKDYMLNKEAMAFFTDLSNPWVSMPNVKSIIILGCYAFDENSDYRHTRKELRGKTARTYSYYPVIRNISKKVGSFIETLGYTAIDGQNVPLKHVANSIGMGTFGWNGILYSQNFGSYFALRNILTDLELEPDNFTPPQMPCDECGKCLKACPTGALYTCYKVNPSLCINPLSRKPSDYSSTLGKKFGSWLCGCDICQEVCPVNKKLTPRKTDARAGFYPENHDSHRILKGLEKNPLLVEIIEGDNNFEVTRNAINALGNIGTTDAIEQLENLQKKNTNKQLNIHFSRAISRAKNKATNCNTY